MPIISPAPRARSGPEARRPIATVNAATTFVLIAAAWPLATRAQSIAGATLPAGVSVARLVTPRAEPIALLVDGRFWRCEGAVCSAGRQDGADSQPLWMECADAAAKLGAFAEYRTGSTILEAAKLSKCNARAKKAE